MNTKIILVFVSLALLLVSCRKNKDDAPPSSIDVSAQWTYDPLGVLMSSNGDGQWQSKNFSSSELNLFASLDTANLIGTTSPASVIAPAPEFLSIYPNPFNPVFSMSFRFTAGYTGEFIFKSVIVDSLFRVIEKKSQRLQATYNGGTQSYISVAFFPNLTPRRYRYYFTMSSQATPHFYKSWGNIQKTP